MSNYRIGDLVWVSARVIDIDNSDSWDVKLTLADGDTDTETDTDPFWCTSDADLVPRDTSAPHLRKLLEQPHTIFALKQLEALTVARAAKAVLAKATADFAIAEEANIRANEVLAGLTSETP